MSANIPLYGQNKDGGGLGFLSDSICVFEFTISGIAAGSGNTDNSDTGFDFPANFIPLWSVAKNTGSVAMAGNACALDVGGVDIIADVNALAAGASVTLSFGAFASLASATNVLVDGGSHLRSASATTDLLVRVVGIDTSGNIDDIKRAL